MMINCDLGEGESAARGRALMRYVQAANVACGGHAGSTALMERYVLWCRESGVLLGAHPGPWSRADYGRREVDLSAVELELLVLQQVGALARVAKQHRVRLHHVKLHGGLYHASERSEAMAGAYVRAVSKWWPGLRVIGLAGGRVARVARAAKVSVWEEAFADRGYRGDGTLIPRGQASAVLGVRAAVEQGRALLRAGIVRTSGGQALAISAQTLCLHSDTPEAPEIAKQLAKLRSRVRK